MYSYVDSYGLAIGILSFFFAAPFVYYLLQKYHLNRKSILKISLLSALGHFIGAYALCYFAVTSGADSVYYFHEATLTYEGMGYHFAFLLLGYAKAYLLGESFLGAFLISGAIAWIASTYFLLIYKILLDKISGPNRLYEIDPKQLTYPALLLLCWPSYFFFSPGLIKDNFAFIGIGMILFVAVRGKLTISSLMMLAIASFFGFMVRPYLFIIFGLSAFIYLLLGSRLTLFFKIGAIGLIIIITLAMLPLLSDYATMMHFSSSSVAQIGKYAVRQQQYMHVGSSIPVPTHDPIVTFLFLPYLLFCNLFLPLGIGANNSIGIISSIENAYFLWIVVVFIRNKALYIKLKNQYPIIKFLMIYFLFGTSCLSIMNSNLGLAMREKMMYVPAFLICILLTYSYKRMQLIYEYNLGLERDLAANAAIS